MHSASRRWGVGAPFCPLTSAAAETNLEQSVWTSLIQPSLKAARFTGASAGWVLQDVHQSVAMPICFSVVLSGLRHHPSTFVTAQTACADCTASEPKWCAPVYWKTAQSQHILKHPAQEN